ncbi:MAG TPA: prenyltransferase [Candidatus Nitrosopolaris rasttigaisensis]|jgi:1,4-dihydroxy-2-naphthoate octaprenyltransferase|nr:prenyltransferase [Candidatus Nitrosopolaris rasttigaisensis]
MIRTWLRAIRVRYLLASVIAVSNGIALAFWKNKQIDLSDAILTFVGVICLHASIDLLNDYWDYKRGIDTATRRTKFSGGTGVLPENLLKPGNVYFVGLIFLLIGTLIGMYFVVIRGIAIALLLGFAILAVYFYSTSIVNLGLGEAFVAIKGTLIVVGSYYVQTWSIGVGVVFVGIIMGILSASVLFVNSFPDYQADRSRGRRTLVILLGRQRAVKIFPWIILCTYVLIIAGIFLGYLKIYSLASLLSVPFAVRAIKRISKSYQDVEKLVPVMGATVAYSRVTGVVLAASLFI